ncbi:MULTISPECIES: hypothetical protein [unclassified Mesorhizobium]|uniref:hypothetical protein n=1 Tax=unclassified Mesorhizobium TaxID=325217 RepID=UPI000B30DE48|nr:MULTISPECIES: hypothetical protein [unclassified Mesorhizobium]
MSSVGRGTGKDHDISAFRDPVDLLVADMTPTLARAMKVAFTRPSTNGSARSMCSRISR